MKKMALMLLLFSFLGLQAMGFAQEEPYALQVLSMPLQTMMEMGESGEQVRLLQAALIRLGFLQGKADGIFGRQTAAAVTNLKGCLAETGGSESYVDPLAPDSAVSSALYFMLTEGKWEDGPASLKRGENGLAVVQLQKRLRSLGYPAETDGTYGPETEYGVELFRYFQAGGDGPFADSVLRTKLYGSDARPARYEPLRSGSKGTQVKNLQSALRLYGFSAAPVDGSYGAATEKGVRLLQECLVARGENWPIDGDADPLLQEELLEFFDPAPYALERGQKGPEIIRLQQRLNLYGFEAGGLDGEFGPSVAAAIQRFQKRNGLQADGQATVATLQKLYSSDIKGALKPYLLKVSTKDQKVYAYSLDHSYEYTTLVRTMPCSTGLSDTPTPKGTFTNTGPGDRWHYFQKYKCWAQYAYYIHGNILFHSVLYSEKNENSLLWGSVYNLGKPASHGCVRLAVEDAKWIYNNCASGTTVIVY